jgi:thymidine kinase
MSNLFALADNILFMKAICKQTGNEAAYSYLSKKTDGKSEVVIGGGDLYNAVDRETFKELNDYL